MLYEKCASVGVAARGARGGLRRALACRQAKARLRRIEAVLAACRARRRGRRPPAAGRAGLRPGAVGGLHAVYRQRGLPARLRRPGRLRAGRAGPGTPAAHRRPWVTAPATSLASSRAKGTPTACPHHERSRTAESSKSPASENDRRRERVSARYAAHAPASFAAKAAENLRHTGRSRRAESGWRECGWRRKGNRELTISGGRCYNGAAGRAGGDLREDQAARRAPFANREDPATAASSSRSIAASPRTDGARRGCGGSICAQDSALAPQAGRHVAEGQIVDWAVPRGRERRGDARRLASRHRLRHDP
jgi:hypothetical protein